MSRTHKEESSKEAVLPGSAGQSESDGVARPQAPDRPRRGRPKGATSPRKDRQKASDSVSAEARQVASVVLEVLGGAVGPAEAATLLGRTPTQYYKLEARALEGLLQACEPRVRGRQRNPEKELEALAASHRKLERECARLQTLVRVLGRAAGVKRKAEPAQTRQGGKKSAGEGGKPGTAAGRKRKRGRKNPAVRALLLARQLGENGQDPMPASQSVSSAGTPDGGMG
ncbi:MAG: hypothetical protein L0Y78_09930 [candidate division NC10 bacterium]|nr:hypothetical protein [candidate division NC10 bacterium]